MSLKTRLADYKYDWAHAPKQQRTGIIACALAVVAILCVWQALAVVQDATLGAKGGNPFAESVEEQTEHDEGSSGVPAFEDARTHESLADAPKSSAEAGIDVSLREVADHAEGCIPIDRLPSTSVEKAPALERQMQALIDARLGGASGASAYIDAKQGVSVAQGETEQVSFAVAVVGPDGSDLMRLGVAYTPRSGQFGITAATVSAEPPNNDGESGTGE